VGVTIREAQSADVVHLISESTRLLLSLYPEESNHFVDAEDLNEPGNLLLAAHEGNAIVGCVGYVDTGDCIEIKRLFVDPLFRGKGIARALMADLEARAIHAGHRIARLETGIHQPESLALYEALGYQIRGPFGDYVDDPLSIFMEKHLT